ncbi:MAG: TIGR03936 family radical SAM-associated protein [Pirellulales bacterium]|nr:TIGR03936 family radical SAM-associated protein [Pirellulales bacterium]
MRIWFRKAGDLRFISHRDLVRTWERIFRRAGLELSRSQGFHPKPRMSFPAALAVGIDGTHELVEVELAASRPADAIDAALRPTCPAGLDLLRVEVLPPGAKKARVLSMSFEFPVPAERTADLSRRIDTLLAAESHLARRDDDSPPVDLRPALAELALGDGRLRMRLLANPQGGARPRAVLEALGLDDLLESGLHLTRTAIELAP